MIITDAMTEKPNGNQQSRTIDLSDLCGTYSLNEASKLLKTLDKRMKEFENEEVNFIKNLKISERLKNSLLRADFETLNELANKTKKEILSIEGIGVTSFFELKEVMNDYGFRLKNTF